MRTTRKTLPWLILGLLLSLSNLARAADAGVKDDGGFFTPNVAQQATTTLQKLSQQYHHKVIVETFATLPNELNGKVDGNEASKNQAYLNFMEMRARSLGADVYIYASKSPGHVDSVARKDVARSGLTDAGRRRMTSDLLAGFKNRDFDGALTNLATSLERTFAEGGNNSPAAAPPANSPDRSSTPAPMPRDSGSAYPPARPEKSTGLLGGLGCFGLVIIAVILFVVIGLVKRLFGGNRNAPPPLPGQGYGGNYPPGGYGQGYGGGGGGFGRGLGGGILGGLLGSWIGGNVFGQSHQSDNSNPGGYSGGQDPGTSGGDASGFSGGGGGDFSSGGDSSGGGSDFSGGGGGDFGGGGGGDSGGGGDGGGGDF